MGRMCEMADKWVKITVLHMCGTVDVDDPSRMKWVYSEIIEHIHPFVLYILGHIVSFCAKETAALQRQCVKMLPYNKPVDSNNLDMCKWQRLIS